MWRIEFVLCAMFAAHVLLIKASSRSGCQALGGGGRVPSAYFWSRVVWECSPKWVVNPISG